MLSSFWPTLRSAPAPHWRKTDDLLTALHTSVATSHSLEEQLRQATDRRDGNNETAMYQVQRAHLAKKATTEVQKAMVEQRADFDRQYAELAHKYNQAVYEIEKLQAELQRGQRQLGRLLSSQRGSER